MRRRWTIALFVAVFGVAVGAGVVLATPPTPGQESTTLGKSLFDPIDASGQAHTADFWRMRLKTQGLSDLYVVDNKIPVGGNTGWHSHPGPSLIMVIAGAVTNYEGDDPHCQGTVHAAGSGFVDPGGTDVHMLRNEGAVPAETIAVQLVPTGVTRRNDKPDPGNCHF